MVVVRNILRKTWLPLVLVIILVGWYGWQFYHRIFSPSVSVQQDPAYLHIPTGATFSMVRDSLVKNNWVSDTIGFGWVSKRKDYTARIRPGRYRLKDGMSFNALVNMLRAGAQEPVRLVIRPFRNLQELSDFLSGELEPNAHELFQALSNEVLLEEVGLSARQAMLLPIPNTYEIWWNTSAEGFASRMVTEYNRFWNESRRALAHQLSLSPAEVGVLASIVQEETNKREELPRIAGVYLNRLRMGMLLQADPTVKFALGNPAIRRILYRHLEIDSPYNTYRYPGIPPGPITMPEVFVIDAVLNPEKHNYLFFCARDDLSGYHSFARTGAEHARNARAYQQALNKKGIY